MSEVRNFSNVARPLYTTASLNDSNTTDTISVSDSISGTIRDGSSYGWPVPPFFAVIDAGSATQEVVKVTAKSGSGASTTYTITRGSNLAGEAYGSTTKLHSPWSVIVPIFSAADMYAASTASSVVESIGADDTILIADSAQSGGFKWGQIATGGIANDAVNGDKIADNSIVNAHIDPLAAISKTKISGTAITQADSKTIVAGNIADDTITATQIAADAITSSELADNSVDTAAIQTNAVTSAKINSGAVGTSQLGSNSVTAAKIASGVITDTHISSTAAIDKTKVSGTAVTIADTGTVTSTMIADGTIQNVDINAAAAIDRSKISGLPTSTTDNTIPRFDGTSGAFQTSSLSITDTNNLVIPGTYASVEPASGSPSVYVKASASGLYTQVEFLTGANSRWSIRKNADTETGSNNTGSNLEIIRRNDAGSSLSSSIKIDRSTGKITFGDVGASAGLELGASGPRHMSGTGNPTATTGSTAGVVPYGTGQNITATNGSTWLQSDDNALTYLKWIRIGGAWYPDFEGRWIAYTATWTNVSMSATTAQYTQRGKQIEFRIVGTLSAAPSGAVSVTIPQTAASTNYFGSARLLVGSANYQGAWYPTSTTVITVRYLDDANIWQALSGTLPAAWASGHTITIAGSYQVA